MEANQEKPEINKPPKEILKEEPKKEGKGLKIGVTICAVLALAGIGFGVYELLQVKSVKQQLSDMKIEVKNADGTTTTIEPDKVEVNNDVKTVVISDTVFPSLSFVADNFAKSAEYTVTAPSYSEEGAVSATTTKSFSIYTWGGDRYTLDANGKISAQLNSWTNSESKDDIALDLPSRAIDMAIGTHGNGGLSWIIFVLEDGTVATLKQLEPFDQKYEVFAVEGAADIVKVYGGHNAIGPLGYAQDKNGKIHDIVLNGDGTESIWTFELADY